MLESVKDSVFVAPAAGLPISMLEKHEELGLKWSAEKIASMESEIETVTHCMRDLHKRGVRVLPGGDYGAFISNPMGGALRKSIRLHSNGAIVAATRQGAALMRMEDQTGRLSRAFKPIRRGVVCLHVLVEAAT